MLFYGKILDLKGAPFEANPEIYNKMKEGIKSCDINYFHGEILSIIENKIHTPIDFISFSDILSYFNEEVETIYLQKIKEKLSPKALTVHRYYLHINYGLNIEGYKLITKNFQDLINKEKTQIYTIDVYQRD